MKAMLGGDSGGGGILGSQPSAGAVSFGVAGAIPVIEQDLQWETMDDAAEILGKLIPATESLMLTGAAVDTEGSDTMQGDTPAALATKMATCALKSLDLSGNRIDSAGLQAMLQAAAQPTGKACRLEKLTLTNTSIEGSAVGGLLALLQAAAPTLTHADLEDCKVGGSMNQIVAALQVGGNIQVLGFNFNEDDCDEDATCEMLATAVPGWPALKKLSMAGFDEEGSGMEALQSALQAAGKADVLMLEEEDDDDDAEVPEYVPQASFASFGR